MVTRERRYYQSGEWNRPELVKEEAVRNILFVKPPSMPYHHVKLSLDSKRIDITNFVKQPIAMSMGIL
jgi:hypothetical protein